MFAPYRPSDYRGLIEEFLEAEEKRNGRKRVSKFVTANGKFVSKSNGVVIKANGHANGGASGGKANGSAHGNGTGTGIGKVGNGPV